MMLIGDAKEILIMIKKGGINIILNITFTTIPIMSIIRLIIEIINSYYR